MCFYEYLGSSNADGSAPGPPMPRPVLPRERGVLDRFIEYLVGDGPSNRYALVCRQCESHNGMALKEEFEYIGKYITKRFNYFTEVSIFFYNIDRLIKMIDILVMYSWLDLNEGSSAL